MGPSSIGIYYDVIANCNKYDASEGSPLHMARFCLWSEWWSILNLNNSLTLTFRNADIKRENGLF